MEEYPEILVIPYRNQSLRQQHEADLTGLNFEHSSELNRLRILHTAQNIADIIFGKVDPDITITQNDAYRSGKRNIMSPITDALVDAHRLGHGVSNKSELNLQAWYLEKVEVNDTKFEPDYIRNQQIYSRKNNPTRWGLLLSVRGELIKYAGYDGYRHEDYKLLDQTNISGTKHLIDLLAKFSTKHSIHFSTARVHEASIYYYKD